MPEGLSKSKILSGLQCHKRLWLEVHRPKLADASEGARRAFNVGHEVNDAARALHEDGLLIEFDEGIPGALAETATALAQSPDRTLFEATFAHDGVAVRVDILKRNARGYRLIEVKSAASVKDPNYPDCAVQAWVLESCGLPLDRVELAHINTQFVYGGAGDYRGLFQYENLTDDIAESKRQMPEWVSELRETLRGEQPDIATGKHCKDPYPCPFIGHCSGPQPDYPLSYLPRGRQIVDELMAEGITDIRDIPPGRLSSDKHIWVRDVTVRGEAELRPAAREVLDACAWPRYYIDFETINLAVPVWKDTRPFQQQPFQWSCHCETQSGEITHQEFLDTSGAPPMRPFIEALLQAVGETGTIFIYSSFERTRLRKLAERFPDLAPAIKAVIRRLVDLKELTEQYYYHPDMHGSWSLKAVLPTIAPDLDYAGLGEVQDGCAAVDAYREIIHPDTDTARAKLLADDLLAYCKRDTEALVALAHFLATGEAG